VNTLDWIGFPVTNSMCDDHLQRAMQSVQIKCSCTFSLEQQWMLRLLSVASTFTSRSSPQQDLIQLLGNSIILLESGLKSVLPNVRPYLHQIGGDHYRIHTWSGLRELSALCSALTVPQMNLENCPANIIVAHLTHLELATNRVSLGKTPKRGRRTVQKAPF